MPNIGDLDFGPQGDEPDWMADIRSDLGKFTNQTWLASNQDIPVPVLDYIGQYAASYAIGNSALLWNAGPRGTSSEWAKAWVVGFVDWYLDPQNAALRNNANSQPDFLETAYRGHLKRAQRLYSGIPWTLAIIKRHDGLWLSGCDDAALNRIEMNLRNATVESWTPTTLRAPLVGKLYLPSVCSVGATKLELGHEILSDWILAPANHGFPFTTMLKAFNDRKSGSVVPRPHDPPGRTTYELLMPGGYYRIVVKDGEPPCVITFFKRT